MDGLIITASKDGDTGFTLDHWTSGIESWRFDLPYYNHESVHQGIIYHSILSQSLAQGGDTVKVSHLMRSQNSLGLDMVKTPKPTHLVLYHEVMMDKIIVPLQWSAAEAQSEVKLPQEIHSGEWSLYLTNKPESSFWENLWVKTGSLTV